MSNPFEQALDVLTKWGWTQGRLRARDGRLCARGALAEALGVLTSEGTILGGSDVAIDHCEAIAARILGSDRAPNALYSTPLTYFNDDPATSEEDVRLLLKHAAAVWDETATKVDSPTNEEGSTT